MHGLVTIKDQSAINNRQRGLGKTKFPFLFQLFHSLILISDVLHCKQAFC